MALHTATRLNDGSYLASPPTHTAGHQPTVTTDSFLASRPVDVVPGNATLSESLGLLQQRLRLQPLGDELLLIPTQSEYQ
jgi:hypothetical protein